MSAFGSATSTPRSASTPRDSAWSAFPRRRSHAPVAWLRAGSLQLHLTESRVPQPSPGHFALEVDDFGAVYRWATTADVLSRAADGSAVFELPGGECQLYVHDPGGNVVEVCHPAAGRWREEIPEMVRLADLYPQNADADRATLFLDR